MERLLSGAVVRELLGHGDVSTTMVDTHVLGSGAGTVCSPLDRGS